MTGDGAQYRVVDMRTAYNSDSRRSLRVDDAPDDTVTLLRFGDVTVNGVPFFVLDPARATGSGMNFVGAQGWSRQATGCQKNCRGASRLRRR